MRTRPCQGQCYEYEQGHWGKLIDTGRNFFSFHAGIEMPVLPGRLLHECPPSASTFDEDLPLLDPGVF